MEKNFDMEPKSHIWIAAQMGSRPYFSRLCLTHVSLAALWTCLLYRSIQDWNWETDCPFLRLTLRRAFG